MMTTTTVIGPAVSSGLRAGTGDTVSVVAGGQVVNTTLAGGSLVAQGGTTFGTLVSLGGSENLVASFSNSTNVASGGSEAVGAGSVANNGTVLAGGSITVSSGGLVNGLFLGNVQSGSYAGFAQLTVGSGARTSGTVYNFWGYGDIEPGGVASASQIRALGDEVVVGGIASGSVVNSGGNQTLLAGQAIGTVVNSGGTLFVDSGASPTGVVLRPGGTIILAGLPYTGTGSATLDPATDLLRVTGGGTAVVSLGGDYSGEYFHLSVYNPSQPVTAISVDTVPCFRRGTLIRTDAGEVPVERLTIGERVLTMRGVMRAIRWIGRRAYAGRFVAGNAGIMPVLIQAGALGRGVPRRDLFVSPRHAMVIGGALVPAEALVNGTGIRQVAAPEGVEYIHIELETHDAVWAEGALSETFLDDGGRGMFQHASGCGAAYAETPGARPRYCLPRIEDGPTLEALRRSLAA